MARMVYAVPLLFVATLASAANPPSMSASDVIRSSAAGAVAAATCTHGSADEHRRNAREGAKQMLQARHMLPKDFEAQYARAYEAESKYMKGKSASERKALCTRLEAQGVHFNAKPPKKH